jgi:hypothetical protein
MQLVAAGFSRQFSASPHRMYATPSRKRVTDADAGSTCSRVRDNKSRAAVSCLTAT